MDKEMSKVYIILHAYDYNRTCIHMVTADKAKADAEMARLDSFDYELYEEFLD